MEHQHYDSQYASWKGWEQAAFGVCDAELARYYDAEVFARRAPKGLKLLEIGFGNGALLAHARERGCQVSGVELNPELVERARTAGFEVFDDIARVAANGRFDLVLAFDVLEHLSHDEIADLLRAAADLTAPDGLIIARFPNADSPLSGVYQHGDVSHKTLIGSGKIRYFCDRLGLKLEYLGRPATPRAANLPEKVKQMAGRTIRRTIEATFERLYLPYPVPFDANYVAVFSKGARA